MLPYGESFDQIQVPHCPRGDQQVDFYLNLMLPVFVLPAVFINGLSQKSCWNIPWSS